jgi:hypothetical protein
LTKVQEEIRALFVPLYPADFHLFIPQFRWHAIVTTNFDLIVERAYDQTPARLQNLAPIFSDGDNFADKIRDPSQVIYLKLHGCITHTNDPKLPLILASERPKNMQSTGVTVNDSSATFKTGGGSVLLFSVATKSATPIFSKYFST